MSSPNNAFQSGTLVEYQFLWSHEENKGIMHGLKNRQCAIILRSSQQDSERIFLIPVTTKQPNATTPSLEIPELEARHMGLKELVRRWIILHEVNVDEIPSYVLEPNAKIGDIGKPYFNQYLKNLDQCLRDINLFGVLIDIKTVFLPRWFDAYQLKRM